MKQKHTVTFRNNTDYKSPTPIATICHNEDNENDPNHRRVTLLAGSDGYIWAQAPGEEMYRTDCPVGEEEKRWSGPWWDFRRISDEEDVNGPHGYETVKYSGSWGADPELNMSAEEKQRFDEKWRRARQRLKK